MMRQVDVVELLIANEMTTNDAVDPDGVETFTWLHSKNSSVRPGTISNNRSHSELTIKIESIAGLSFLFIYT